MRDRLPGVTTRPDGLMTQRLFGLDFVDAPSVEDVVDVVLRDAGADGRDRLLVTPNVDIVVQIQSEHDASGWSAVQSATWVLPDGAPIVWASRFVGRPLRARLTGSDLFPLLWPRLEATATPVFALASSLELGQRLSVNEAATVATASFVQPDDTSAIAELAEACVDCLTSSGARLALLFLGHPKDALIAEQILRSPHRPSGLTICCLGASAEMHFGLRRRAPRWAQRWGAEWLFRLVQEPGRLWRRYLVRDLAFIPLALRERLGT